MTTKTTITTATDNPLAEWVSVNDSTHDEATAIIIGTIIEAYVRPDEQRPEPAHKNTPWLLNEEKPGAKHFEEAFIK